MSTTVYEVKNHVNLFSVVSLSLLLPSKSMFNLIYNRCIIKTTATYVYANEQLRQFIRVLVHYFVAFDIHLWKLYWNKCIRLGLT